MTISSTISSMTAGPVHYYIQMAVAYLLRLACTIQNRTVIAEITTRGELGHISGHDLNRSDVQWV